jgi:hypothetical protein
MSKQEKVSTKKGKKHRETIIYLNHENTRHYGSIWEMPLEEVIIY